jgi:hypothetical protein
MLKDFTMMNIIRREKYISKIQAFIGKNIIKVLVGLRRIGKTYILYQLMNDIKKTDKKAHIKYQQSATIRHSEEKNI